jgi:acetoin utilization deacetylase AcuC-like enzyme
LIEEATLSKTEFVPLDVAKRLDIHLVEVDQAIGRLERLGRIRKAEPKEGVPSYRKIEQEVSIFSQVPSEALRKFHTQWLEKTLRALHEQTQAERYTSTETLILSENQLQEAERIFDEALDRVTALSQTRDRGGEVHHIGIHRIRVTHPRKKGKSP